MAEATGASLRKLAIHLVFGTAVVLGMVAIPRRGNGGWIPRERTTFQRLGKRPRLSRIGIRGANECSSTAVLRCDRGCTTRRVDTRLSTNRLSRGRCHTNYMYLTTQDLCETGVSRETWSRIHRLGSRAGGSPGHRRRDRSACPRWRGCTGNRPDATRRAAKGDAGRVRPLSRLAPSPHDAGLRHPRRWRRALRPAEAPGSSCRTSPGDPGDLLRRTVGLEPATATRNAVTIVGTRAPGTHARGAEVRAGDSRGTGRPVSAPTGVPSQSGR